MIYGADDPMTGRVCGPCYRTTGAEPYTFVREPKPHAWCSLCNETLTTAVDPNELIRLERLHLRGDPLVRVRDFNFIDKVPYFAWWRRADGSGRRVAVLELGRRRAGSRPDIVRDIEVTLGVLV